MKPKQILSVFFIVGLVACSKVVEYELPYDGDKIVLNCILWANEPISVSVTKSAPPTGTISNDLALNDATVDFFENGNYLETFKLNPNGFYESITGFMPVEGQEYYLVVSSTNFETVRSLPVKIPSKPNVVLNEVTKNPYHENTAGLQAKIVIKDPENETNFYQLSSYGSLNNNKEWLQTQYYLLGVSYDAPPPCYNFSYLGELYSDYCENGNDINFILNIQNEFYPPGIPSINFDKILIPVANISSDYYNYLLEYNRVTGIELVFFNPEMLPTNVEGGYGIVGSGNREILKIIL